MHRMLMDDWRREAGRSCRTRVGWRQKVLPASCTLALWALSVAGAAPESLTGTTLCLSPTTSVFASGVPGPNPYKLADRIYAEMKSFLRAQGVQYTEASVCKKSTAALTLFLDVTPMLREAALETRVSGRVDDESQREPNKWLSPGVLRWSAVRYGKAGKGEAEVAARLLADTRTMLDGFVKDWKAANR